LANGEQQTKEHIAWLGGAISSQDIGRWGEEYAFVALRRKLLENCHNEHPEVDVKEFQGGCVIHSGGQTLVEIRWTKKETNESPDIKVVVDGIDKYFEVKSTTSYNEMDVAISKTQWRLAEEKREQFCILRVCGVGTMRATVYEIWNPYELWLKGKLIVEDRTILPVSELQLPTNEVELGKPDATVIRREPQQRAAKSKADRGRYVEGIGKRKAATARVRLYTGGTGSIVINHKPGGEYFSRDGDLDKALEPLWLVHCDQMNISIVVKGGGMTGQADAIRLGIARALLKLDGNLRNQFRQKGFLTRDARVKERKKPGLKRARKAPQYTKR
jgi:small subunit ribosomal protein S9